MAKPNGDDALIKMLRTVKSKDEGMSKMIDVMMMDSLNTTPSECNHYRQRGSDSGITCMDCGTDLLGFGVENTAKDCVKHEFRVVVDLDDIPLETFCTYCKKLWEISDIRKVSLH